MNWATLELDRDNLKLKLKHRERELEKVKKENSDLKEMMHGIKEETV